MKCARTVCQSDGQLKHLLNQKLYCVRCARLIRENNPDYPGLVEWPGKRMYDELEFWYGNGGNVRRIGEILLAFGKDTVEEVLAMDRKSLSDTVVGRASEYYAHRILVAMRVYFDVNDYQFQGGTFTFHADPAPITLSIDERLHLIQHDCSGDKDLTQKYNPVRNVDDLFHLLMIFHKLATDTGPAKVTQTGEQDADGRTREAVDGV